MSRIFVHTREELMFETTHVSHKLGWVSHKLGWVQHFSQANCAKILDFLHKLVKGRRGEMSRIFAHTREELMFETTHISHKLGRVQHFSQANCAKILGFLHKLVEGRRDGIPRSFAHTREESTFETTHILPQNYPPTLIIKKTTLNFSCCTLRCN